MKYNVGDKFYKYNKGRLLELEIEEITYKIKGGTIQNAKHAREKNIDKGLEMGEIYLTKDFFKEEKIQKKIAEIDRLKEEIEMIKEVYR